MKRAKPKWSGHMRRALDLRKQAELMVDQALVMRCTEEESGGHRCTADAEPADHRHRIQEEDLP